MQSTDTSSRKCYYAALVPPSLHVIATPLWVVLGGRPELAMAATAWQVIAWIFLASAALLTLTPIVLLARKHLASILPNRAAMAALSVSSAFGSSFFLFGAPPYLQSIPVCWFLALASSLSAYLAMRPTAKDGLNVA